jgi:hypothetical protein
VRVKAETQKNGFGNRVRKGERSELWRRPARRSVAEDNDVLARKRFDGLDPIKRQHGHFLLNLRLRHLVERLYGDVGVLAPIFHKDHTSAGLQRAANPLHHFPWVTELVINIHQQCQVHRRSWKLRINYLPKDRNDVGKALVGAEVFEQGDHLGLNIHSQDLSRRAYGLCQAAADVTRASANVGHNLTTPKPELADQLVRLFLCDALGPFQPIGRLMAHDLGDLASHVDLANAIRVMGLVKSITVGWAGDLLRQKGQFREQAGADRDNEEKEATPPSPPGR